MDFLESLTNRFVWHIGDSSLDEEDVLLDGHHVTRIDLNLFCA